VIALSAETEIVVQGATGVRPVPSVDPADARVWSYRDWKLLSGGVELEGESNAAGVDGDVPPPPLSVQIVPGGAARPNPFLGAMMFLFELDARPPTNRDKRRHQELYLPSADLLQDIAVEFAMYFEPSARFEEGMLTAQFFQQGVSGCSPPLNLGTTYQGGGAYVFSLVGRNAEAHNFPITDASSSFKITPDITLPTKRWSRIRIEARFDSRPGGDARGYARLSIDGEEKTLPRIEYVRSDGTRVSRTRADGYMLGYPTQGMKCRASAPTIPGLDNTPIVSVHGVGFARPVDELLIPGSNRSVAT
jgi:hypothetical protein